MKYKEYLDEREKFIAGVIANSKLPESERKDIEPHHWMWVLADVTCETPGCPHGTQQVSLAENGAGIYHSHCGNCNTTNSKIVGIFDDGPVELRPHMPELDPWAINEARS